MWADFAILIMVLVGMLIFSIARTLERQIVGKILLAGMALMFWIGASILASEQDKHEDSTSSVE